MQKDVIYIDVDDDITAIIGKVKDTKQKIVALVPPKRIGVLQSAVNLRLIQRVANQHGKKLVVITGNDALGALAASAKIPVAKNLQSRPELGEIAALDVDDGDDIIDGSQLPVGEHAKQSAVVTTAPLDAAAADVMSDSDAINIDDEVPKESPKSDRTDAKNGKKTPKVPNFNLFRKKLLIFGCLGVLLIAFLVWAVFFAGRATVYITAKTNDTSINDTVTLSTSSNTDPANQTLRVTQQATSQDVSIPFTATGSKNVGDKATGTVTLSHQSQGSTTVAAGTGLTSSSGLVYTTDSDTTVPPSTVGGSCFPTACAGSTTVTVTADQPGAKYNGASGGLSGAPSGVSANFNNATSGGTDKTVKVVTKSDLAGAKQKLDDSDTSSAKSALEKQFGKDVKPITDTFQSDTSGVTPSPAVGSESSDGTAKLAGTVKNTMYGVANSELSDYLDSYFKSQLGDQTTQRIYDSGVSTVSFSNVDTGKTVTAQMTADGKIGPKIDDAKVKKLAEGKRYSEIQQALQSIQGVSNVDVKYWPFWVTHAPNNPDRISVKFKLDDSK